MKRKYRKIDWADCKPIEKCTDMGDTNGNAIDEEIEELKTESQEKEEK